MPTPSEALLRHGSDKVGAHSYGPIYDSLFDLDRFAVRSLLEVGLLDGASVRAWADAFPHAAIHGIDVDPEAGARAGETCRFAAADASDPASVARAVSLLGIAPLSLDVAIDDGSHFFRDQVATFLLLWDYLRPGGIYVIEDIQPTTPVAVFARLGGLVYDFRSVRDRDDDVLVVFHKPAAQTGDS